MKRPTDWTADQKLAALSYLLRDRCGNYGYDYAAFRRISAQRTRARQAVKRFANTAVVCDLHWETVSDRLTCKMGADLCWQAHYIVGQSSNEEITNVLRRLANPDAQWVS